jgi:uncharacterized protein YjiK
MSIKVWSFLVSRNRYLDYRTVVAPDFLCDLGSANFLAKAAGGNLTKEKYAVYREIHNLKNFHRDQKITLVFRVIEAFSPDIENNKVLKDAYGRNISFIVGIVLQGSVPQITVTPEIFAEVHNQVLGDYKIFWNYPTPEPALPSKSFDIQQNHQKNCLILTTLEPFVLSYKSTQSMQEPWKPVEELHAKQEVESLTFSFEGEILAIRNNCSLQIWYPDRKPPNDLSPDDKFGQPKLIIPNYNGDLFAICYVGILLVGDFIVLWNRKTDKRYKFFSQDKAWVKNLITLAISPNAELLATCSGNECIEIWDVKTQMKLTDLRDYTNSVQSVTFSPDSKFLASGHNNGTISLWEPKNGSLVCSEIDAHPSSVKSIAFSSDGQLLASADVQGTIKISNLNTKTFKKAQSIDAHKLTINSITFSPDGKRLASGSDDGTIKLWDVKSGKNIFTSPEQEKAVNSITFDMKGETLISGGDDKLVTIWRQE